MMPVPEYKIVNGELQLPSQQEDTRIVTLPDGTEAEVPIGVSPDMVMEAYQKKVNKYPWSPQALKERFVKPEKAPETTEQVLTPAQERAKKTINVNAEPQTTGIESWLEKAAVGIDRGLDTLSRIYNKGVVPEDQKKPLTMGGPLAEAAEAETRRRDLAAESQFAQEYWPQEKIKSEWIKARQSPITESPEWYAVKREVTDKTLGALSATFGVLTDVLPGTITELYRQAKTPDERINLLKAIGDATGAWFDRTMQLFRGDFADQNIPEPPLPYDSYYEQVTGEKPSAATSLFGNIFYDASWLLDPAIAAKSANWLKNYGLNKAFKKAIQESEMAAGPALRVQQRVEKIIAAEDAFRAKSAEATAGAAERYAPKPLTAEEEAVRLDTEFRANQSAVVNAELEKQARIAELNEDYQLAAALRADKVQPPTPTRTGANARPIATETPPPTPVFMGEPKPSTEDVALADELVARETLVRRNPDLMTKAEAQRFEAGGEPPPLSVLQQRERDIVEAAERREAVRSKAASILPPPSEIETIRSPNVAIHPETNRAALAEETREKDLMGLNGPDRKASAMAEALDYGYRIPEGPIDATKTLFKDRDRFQGGRSNREGFAAPAAIAGASAMAGAPLAVERDDDGRITGINALALAGLGVPIIGIIVGRNAASKIKIGIEQAEALRKAGISSDEIRRMTGWWENNLRPGELKFEISDANARFKRVENVAGFNDPSVSFRINGEDVRLPANGVIQTNLASVVDHPIMFQAYPDMANLKVTMVDKTLWDRFYTKVGLPSRTKSFIVIPRSSSSIADAEIFTPATHVQRKYRPMNEGSFFHEIQHAIQYQEGFEYKPSQNITREMPIQKAQSIHAASPAEQEANYVEKKFLEERAQRAQRTQRQGAFSPEAAGIAAAGVSSGAAQGTDDERKRDLFYAIAGGVAGVVALPKLVKSATVRLAKELKGNPEMAMIAKSIGDEPEKPNLLAKVVTGIEKSAIDRIVALNQLPKEGKLGISGAYKAARTQSAKTSYLLQEALDALADPEIGVGNKAVRNNKDLFALDVKAARDISRAENLGGRLGEVVSKFDGAKAAASAAQREYEQALKEWDTARQALRLGMPGAAQDYEQANKKAANALKRRDAALRDVEQYEKTGQKLNRPINQSVLNPATGAVEEITADIARKAQQQIAKVLKQRGYDYADFERAKENWKRITDQKILQVLEDAGIVSKKRADSIRAANDFYATYEYLDLAASDDLIKPLQGAPQEVFQSDIGAVIRNPIDATIAKMQAAYHTAGRNAVLQEIVKPEVAMQNKKIFRIAESAEELERLQAAGVPVVGEEEARYYSRRNLAPIAVYENGKRNRYLIPTELFDAVQNVGTRHLARQIPRIISATSTILREAATSLNLPFAIANVFRDAGLAYLSSPVYGMSPTNLVKFAVDWISGLGSAIKHEMGFASRVDDYLRHGGGFGYAGWAREETDQFAKLLPSSWRKISNLVLSPAHLVRATTEASELATRLGVFRRALKMNYTMDEAAFLARCATIDFTRGGTTTKILNMWIPFLNARIQGSVTLVEALKRNPGLFMAKLLNGVILPAAATTAWNLTTDPEGYYQIDSRLRDDYFIILTGRGKDENGRDAPIAIYIPKGTQGKLWNPFQSVIDKKWNDDPRNTWGAQVVGLLEAVLPVEFTDREGKFSPTKIMSGLLPPLATAVGQAAVNRKFYWDQPIDYPWETMGPGYKPPSMRYSKYTPELYKRMGEYLEVSPKQIQAFASALIGPYADPIKAVTYTTERFYRTEGSEPEIQAIRITQDLERSEATAKRYAEQAFLDGRNDWRNPIYEHNKTVKEQIKRLGKYVDDPKIVKNIENKYQITLREIESLPKRMKKKQQSETMGYLERRFGK